VSLSLHSPSYLLSIRAVGGQCVLRGPTQEDLKLSCWWDFCRSETSWESKFAVVL